MTRALILAALLVTLGAGSAAAHGFHLELRAKGTSVHGEAYFGDGTPPGEASWTAFRKGEQAPLASGELDAQGHFDWTAPAPGTYRCEVKEVGLHVASAEVVVREVPGGSAASGSTPSASPAPDEARRRPRGSRGNRGRVKRLLTGLGGIALLGVGLYRFQRRRREREEDEAEDDEEGDAARPSQEDA